MKTALAEKTDTSAMVLTKANPALPAFEILGGELLALRTGVAIALAGRTYAFADGATVHLEFPLEPGQDFVVDIADGKLFAHPVTVREDCDREFVIGGGHFSPGRAATARQGGDDVPGFDPFSLWDRAFRPACPDPRGMVFVAGSRGAPTVTPFWMDKYLLAQDHLEGTSRLGATIADGRNEPQNLDGRGRFANCNWHTVKAVLAHHGKSIPSLDEFFAAAYGVKEKSAAEDRSEMTVLDAERTSAFGVVQATGQRWIWGHDGDPDEPRASLFGGCAWHDDDAGSRYANVGHWPGDSSGRWGGRGRSDHLQLV